MKKFISALILIIIASGISLAGERKLLIGTDDWPPYEFLEGVKGNEYISGFSTEVILSVLCKMKTGINGRIEQFPWARGEKMVINGDIDMLYTAATSDERAKITHYPSESLIESAWSFFIRSEDARNIKYENFEDLKEKRIGVVRAYVYTPELWNFMKDNKNYEEVTGDEQNINKLKYKRVDVIVMDLWNGLYLIKKLGLEGKIIPLEKPIKKISLYAIFSKESLDRDYVDEFSKELKAFKQTSDYKALLRKYFPDTTTPSNQ